MSNLATNEERILFLDQKAQELQESQQEDLVADYDAALKEYETKNKPHLIKFSGEVFEIPNEMPFKFATFYFRHCVKKVAGKTQMQVPEDRLYEFIELMFGKRFLSVLETSDAGMNFVFRHIVPDIMKMWGQDVDASKGTKERKNAMTRA